MPRRCFSRLFGLALFLAAMPARAALSNAPHQDITFIAEHAAEAPQDARHFALALPSQALEPGRWTGGLSVGRGEASAEFIEVEGQLVSVYAFHAWSAKNGLALQGFYDSFHLGGKAGEQILRVSFVSGVPLDLPERIEVTNPRGKVLHYGVGAAWLRELSPRPARGWCLVMGALVERLELNGFEMDYRLLGGRDIGARSLLDYSSSNVFVTPYFGVLRRVPLGLGLLLTPHVTAGVPLPAGDFDSRVTGPGFDLSSRGEGGAPAKIGDGFVALGAGLLHRASGLELNVGGALIYPLFEKTTHDGVDRSLLVVLSWRLPGH